MARKKKPKKKESEPRVGTLKPAGAAIFLAVVAFFLKDFYGLRYGLTGGYIWLAAFGISLLVGLFYMVQHVLPLPWQESWYEALRLTIDYNFPGLAALLRGKTRFKQGRAALPGVESELSSGFKTHRAGIIHSHTALAIAKGASFSRAAGPGYVSLEKGEVVSQVIDLRRHYRQLPVKIRTQDGIPLETTVGVLFQVNPPEENLDPDLPYPYDAAGIFQVNYLANFSTGDSALPWTERVGRQAVSAVIAELSQHTLDELYVPDPAGAPPLEAITGRVKKQLADTFKRHGIHILSVGIGSFEVPEGILQQRIDNWQTEWQRRAVTSLATGKAEALRNMMLARANAQLRFIQDVLDSIGRVQQQGSADLSQIISHRMIEAMAEIGADDKVQALVPKHVITTLRQVQDLVQR